MIEQLGECCVAPLEFDGQTCLITLFMYPNISIKYIIIIRFIPTSISKGSNNPWVKS